MTRDDRVAIVEGAIREAAPEPGNASFPDITDASTTADADHETGALPHVPSLHLACGARIELLDVHQLAKRLSGCSRYHRVVVMSRGYQRGVWYGVKEVSVGQVGRGSITVVPANLPGRLEITDVAGLCCVSIPITRMDACADAIGFQNTPTVFLRLGVADRMTSSIVELMGDAVRNQDETAQHVCERAIDLLCFQILRRYSSIASASESKRRGLAPWHLRKVSEYVEPRLARPLSLEDLASHVGLSRFHFCASFKRATGITPNEWLTIKRMDRAAHLLVNSNLCILDISQAVGFGSASAFSACFKRVMGVTPTTFRHQPDTSSG